MTMRLAEPFSLSPFIVTLILGILLGVVEFGLFMELPIVIFVLIYIFWITSNYFIEIIEFKALGSEGWPVFSWETLVALRSQLGVVFGVLVLAAASGYLALRYFSYDGLATALLGAGLAILPGSAALLAVTREFAAALNPVKVLSAILGLGHTYLYCLAGAAVILVLSGHAQSRGGLWYFPLVYALFLYAYLIGSSVYLRRRQLGVSSPRSPEARAERQNAETVATRKEVSTYAYGLAAHGNVAAALKYIDAYIAAEEDTLEARLWIFQETVRWEASDVALAFGRHLIEYCNQLGFDDEAASVARKCDLLKAHR